MEKQNNKKKKKKKKNEKWLISAKTAYKNSLSWAFTIFRR